MNNANYCITFAGPIGCSKSPVAHYISMAFGWPIFSHDAVRHEVMEDTRNPILDIKLLEERITERTKFITGKNESIIYDASQDRHWDRFIAAFQKTPPYQFGVISFDLSRDFYEEILRAKHYDSTLLRAKKLLDDHEAFVHQYKEVIICSITDATFQDRLYIAEEAVRKFTSDKTNNIG
jgi:hypothetical protein